MLIDIITDVGYYVDLNELYATRQPSSCIEKERSRDIVNDLTNIMKTKKDRRIMEEGSRVYSTQPKREPKISALEKAMRKRILELEEAAETRSGKGAERVVYEKSRSKGGSYNNAEDTPPPHPISGHATNVKIAQEQKRN